ncbi:BQ5605_C007g04854 [Microbotryum silenes-dioicae]|uniref:BQ5605_C007g04854 protein n=1 Tax=Microbotryum silenes-dioicae TaxID=796604 RepID=A0A2X0MC97_9BASI|nr:BQ5605_C007g04854 [Microbotryum silenes-dioicae]
MPSAFANGLGTGSEVVARAGRISSSGAGSIESQLSSKVTLVAGDAVEGARRIIEHPFSAAELGSQLGLPQMACVVNHGKPSLFITKLSIERQPQPP